MSRNIKDLILRVTALASAVMIATACPQPNLSVSVSSVSLNTTSITLTLGDRDNDSYQLQATVNPSNAENKDVNWSSDNGTVASVDNTGLVKAKAVGDAVITVTTVDGNKTATCKVKVETKKYQVKEIRLNKSTAEVLEGETITLIANILPSNATDKSVKWSSNNGNVASVDQNGRVKGIKAGKTTITVSSVENENIKASCDITVVAKKISVTEVKLDKTSLDMTEGDEVTLTATVKPDDATNKNVIWSSSKTSVATVDANGKVVAKAAGTAVITVSSDENEDIKATCTVTVKAKKISVTEVKLDKTSLDMTEGDEVTLTATVKPDDATDKSVRWSSNNTTVATVKDGRITANKVGTATITVYSVENEDIKATCKVTVKARTYSVTGVTLDVTSKEMNIGETFTLKAKIEPSNATNQNVTWTSLDPSVATVNNNGKVTAKKAGFTVITVTTEDGNYKATCEITVLKEYDNEDGETVEDEDGEW